MSASRERYARLSLAVCALFLAAGGIVHMLSYPKAGNVLAHSGLNSFFSAAIGGVWLSVSTTSLALALAFGSLAVRPRLATPAFVAILSLAPLGSALAIYLTVGSFVAAHVMLAAGAAALAGAALRGPD